MIANRLKAWMSDKDFQHLITGAFHLFIGNVGVSVTRFAVLILTARAIGKENLGILAIIQAFCLIAGRIFSFQTWQAGIKYGTDMLDCNRNDGFSRLIKFLFKLDLFSGLFAAIFSFLVIMYGSSILVELGLGGISRSIYMYRVEAALYTATIIFVVLSNTPIAVLRIFDKFRTYAVTQFIQALIRLIFVVVAWFLKANFRVFIGVYLVSEIIGQCLMILVALYLLRLHGYGGWLKQETRGFFVETVGLRKFLWSTFWSGKLNIVPLHLDIILVGSFGTASAAGLYKLAKTFSAIFSRIRDPIGQVVYPKLCRLYAGRDISGAIRLIKRFGALMGVGGFGVFLVFIFVGQRLLQLTAGSEFVEAYLPTCILMFSFAILATGVALLPAILAMDKAHIRLRIQCLTIGLQLFALVLLVPVWGATGAGIAALLQSCVWFLCTSWLVSKGLTGVDKKVSI